MKRPVTGSTDELRPEYVLTGLLKDGVRGKYAKRYHAGTNLILIEADIRGEFRTAKEVNDPLRLVIELRKIDRRRRTGRASKLPAVN